MKMIFELFIKQKTWFNFVSFLTEQTLLYQWTNALLAYIKSNLWSSLAQASFIAVVLERQQTARMTFGVNLVVEFYD